MRIALLWLNPRGRENPSPRIIRLLLSETSFFVPYRKQNLVRSQTLLWRACETATYLKSRKGLLSRFENREKKKAVSLVTSVARPERKIKSSSQREMVTIPSKKSAQSAFLLGKFERFSAEPAKIWPDQLLPKARFRPKRSDRGIEFLGHTQNDVRLLKHIYDVFRYIKCIAFDTRDSKFLLQEFKELKTMFRKFPDIFYCSPFCTREMNGLAVTIRLLKKDSRVSEGLHH